MRAIAVLGVVLVGAVCTPGGGVITGPKLATDQTVRVMIADQPLTLDPGQTQYPYETAVLRAISEPLVKPLPDLSGVAPAAAVPVPVRLRTTARRAGPPRLCDPDAAGRPRPRAPSSDRAA